MTIAFKLKRAILTEHELACDECHKSTTVQIDERTGEASALLAALEPYERAALAREGCPHAAPPAVETEPALPEPAPE